MSKRRFVAVAAGTGVAVPVVWLSFYWSFLRSDPAMIHSIMSSGHVDRLLVAIWPSWIFFIADPGERSVAIPLLATALNGLLYGLFGWLIWVGLHKSWVILVFAAVALLFGWYLLLGWYAGI